MRTLIPFLFCASGVIAAELHVGAGQTYATVAAAINAARGGDSVMVHAGIYQEGNLKLNKSITLTGIGFPVLDGVGKHEVLTITAPDVRISGFEVKNSGVSSLEDYAGIKITGAERVTIEGNRLDHCNFSIYLSKAKDCKILNNHVCGNPGREHDTGNGIHLWSCDRITVSGNHVRDHRDGIYLEFATESVMEDNQVENNLRYGLHFMFSHGNAYRRNSFQRNGAGVAVMYSRNVEMTSNHFGFNWGAASYGLLLKDMTDGRIADNSFERNTVGIAMHGSNRMTIERNEFSGNGWAVQVQSSSSGNAFLKNNFSGNSFDIAADGDLDDNRLENNYWDKYEGYDLKRDGAGDVPFRPVSLYAVVVGRVPSSVLLLRSPIVHLLDQAEKAFPSITPERVIDEKPAMHRHPLHPYQPKTKTP
jgi:nitrous oxidase accessory protein